MSTLKAGAGSAVRLRALSLVDDGDSVVVGDRQSGVFVTVPPVGGVVIRALMAGESVAQAQAAAERLAGQPVNVKEFITRLDQLGFVIGGVRESAPVPRPTAALQQRRWMRGPRQQTVAFLFGRAAWVTYAAFFVFSAGCFLLRPQLWPRPGDAFVLHEAGPSLLLLFPFSTALVAVHECWHWLAARAAGVQARFGIDHRLYFLVFETDLSQLWSVPRKRRLGPILAGLAADSAILAALLSFRLAIWAHWWTPPPLAGRLAAALIFVDVAGMLWQCLLFLRTDLYGAMVVATGCHNLWRVKSLLLRRALSALTSDQAAELDAADPRDVTVGTWFRWLWLAGLVAALAWFFAFYMPLLGRLAHWIGPGLAAGPRTQRFWITMGTVAVLLWRFGLPALFSIRKMNVVQQHFGRRRRIPPAAA